MAGRLHALGLCLERPIPPSRTKAYTRGIETLLSTIRKFNSNKGTRETADQQVPAVDQHEEQDLERQRQNSGR